MVAARSGALDAGTAGTKVDFSLSQHAKRYKAKLFGRYIDDYYAGNDSTDPIPSYMVVDIYGEAIIVEGVSVFAGLNNIGDEEYCIYTDLPGGQAGLYLMPGRTVTVGLKYGY